MIGPEMIEILKIGGPVLAFAVVLLYATLRDKERMAKELNADKLLLMAAFQKNTEAFLGLKNLLEDRPCIMKRDRGGNGG
jgi:hypothetical protein